MLSTEHAKQKAKIILTFQMSSKASFILHFRDYYYEETGFQMKGGGGCELDSNFHQLMLLRAKDDPAISDILKQETSTYSDHHISE